jgi:erythromycin esterase-like protein
MLRARTRKARPSIVDAVGAAVQPLAGDARDYDALLELVGDARFVLIGEASHGTREFYAERAVITRRLIVEQGFSAVCIEGDWPDAHRVDRYVRSASEDVSAEAALGGFSRFPAWMWRNEVVRDFVAWLSDYNDDHHDARVGFYGLDLYSLFGSIRSVLEYLDGVDPEAARRARHRYGCFEHFGEDSHAYGYATGASVADPCEDEAVRQLVDLRSQAFTLASRDGAAAAEEFFSAEQNARLVRNAEQYYRSMYRGRASSWNMRDRHMAETLEAVSEHLRRSERTARIVVWAHNSHLGDARYTDMRRRGELNLGQLVRERYGADAVCLIGFSTNTGTVTAAHDWDEPGRQMRVRPALADSYERIFADVSAERGVPRFLLALRGDDSTSRALAAPRLQRAIGVIYRPETERLSHYYDVELPRQFDAMIHIDDTSAIRGLEPGEHWERGVEEVPETFPSGM